MVGNNDAPAGTGALSRQRPADDSTPGICRECGAGTAFFSPDGSFSCVSCGATTEEPERTDSRAVPPPPGAGAPKPSPEEPLPLTRELGEAPPFPAAALGNMLGGACRAIVELTQAPEALCAQSVLAVAALAAQGRIDVVLPMGNARPVSCYFVTVAPSGERKTTADDLAMKPVRQFEGELAAEHDSARLDYRNRLDAWKHTRSEGLKAKGPEAKAAALAALGPEPVPPPDPLLTCPEPTFEGLCKLYLTGRPSLGLFSSEGGQFIGGHGMNQDNRMKTAAGLSGLWDGQPIRRVRAGDGTSYLPGRRLSAHLLVQPGVAGLLLSDPLLADQGLLSRLLVAAPASLMGSRRWKESSAEGVAELARFHSRVLSLLRDTPPVRNGGALEPRPLSLAREARGLWIKYSNAVEVKLGTGGEYERVRSFAAKLPEHAARLAAILALFDDNATAQVSGRCLARGIELADYYAAEAIRLFETAAIDPDLRLAAALLAWLQSESWPHELVSLPDIYQRGPNAIRDKKTAGRIVARLEEHRWLVRVDDGATVAGQKRRDAWRIIGK